MKKELADPERYLLDALAKGDDGLPRLSQHNEAKGKKALLEFAHRLDAVIRQKGGQNSEPINHEYVTHLYLAIDSLKLGNYCKACNLLGNAIHCTTSRPALCVIYDLLAPYLK